MVYSYYNFRFKIIQLAVAATRDICMVQNAQLLLHRRQQSEINLVSRITLQSGAKPKIFGKCCPACYTNCTQIVWIVHGNEKKPMLDIWQLLQKYVFLAVSMPTNKKCWIFGKIQIQPQFRHFRDSNTILVSNDMVWTSELIYANEYANLLVCILYNFQNI